MRISSRKKGKKHGFNISIFSGICGFFFGMARSPQGLRIGNETIGEGEGWARPLPPVVVVVCGLLLWMVMIKIFDENHHFLRKIELESAISISPEKIRRKRQ
jgi:hypothetical protein